MAVLVSGDKDFIPALLRTREKGKRVCICSMRGATAREYISPEANVKVPFAKNKWCVFWQILRVTFLQDFDKFHRDRKFLKSCNCNSTLIRNI